MTDGKLNSAKWEQLHRKHVEEYLRQIDALYDAASEELVRLGIGYNYQPQTSRLFAFSSNKSRRKQADTSLSSFGNKLSAIITAGIATEWAFANDKSDSWVKQLFDDPKKGWMLHNLNALEAFQSRMTYGHTLSERVWSIAKQFERHVELSLSVGISEGRSAANISRDVRMYLNEPDKLFRRVRDVFGNLTLSKAAQVYHPGQGVYRSSYQNAMRMARTEINSAYREADSILRQQLDFIVGYEVKTSKSHAQWLAKFGTRGSRKVEPRWKYATLWRENIRSLSNSSGGTRTVAAMPYRSSPTKVLVRIGGKKRRMKLRSYRKV